MEYSISSRKICALKYTPFFYQSLVPTVPSTALPTLFPQPLVCPSHQGSVLLGQRLGSKASVVTFFYFTCHTVIPTSAPRLSKNILEAPFSLHFRLLPIQFI